MSGPLLPATSSQPHSLSEAASSLVRRVPELLRRLRALQREETKLDAQARQLMAQLPKTKDRPSEPSQIISTPISKLHVRDTENTVDRGTLSTPPYIDPRNMETPVKAFLLMESFALAMSVKSKRKGRIFLAGDSTEFGEKKKNQSGGVEMS